MKFHIVFVFFFLRIFIPINCISQVAPTMENSTQGQVKIFEELLKTIGNKTIDSKIRQGAMDQAIELFYSDTCEIEVINKSMKEPKKLKIRDYLNRVYDYGYTDVKIQWKYINIIGDIKMKDDGFYYGMVRIYQLFEGTAKGFIYKDITEKDLEVRLEKRYFDDGQKLSYYFNALLGNMTISRLIESEFNKIEKKDTKKEIDPKKP